jgi:hypothetical protein
VSYLDGLFYRAIQIADALVTRRPILNFTSGFSFEDDSANNRTNVSVSASSLGGVVSATADTLALRGSSGESYFAFTGSASPGASTTGWARFSSAAGTFVSARNAANDTNLVGVGLDGADGWIFGDAGAASATMRADNIVLEADGSVVVYPTGAFYVSDEVTDILVADYATRTVKSGTGSVDWTLAADATGSPTPDTCEIVQEPIARAQTTDGSTSTLWSYTMPADAVITLEIEVRAKFSDLEILQKRILRTVNTGTIALTTDTIGTDVNTIAGTSAVVYDENGGALRIRITGDNPNTIKWEAKVLRWVTIW